MTIKFDASRMTNIDGKAWLCIRPTDDTLFDARKFALSTKDNDRIYDMDIRRHYEKRSLSANAYAWTLLDKIAQAIRSTKEEVYREIIKRVGVFQDLYVPTDQAYAFCKAWQSNGTGWPTEMLGDTNGYSAIRAYVGSSQYNKQEMGRFIDEIVDECATLGIETMTPDEIANMKSLWGEKA